MVVDAVPEHWSIVRELVDRHDISASPRILQGTSHAERREPARGAGFEDDGLLRAAFGQVAAQDGVPQAAVVVVQAALLDHDLRMQRQLLLPAAIDCQALARDRKSVVMGKSVEVRVNLEGLQIDKKK